MSTNKNKERAFHSMSYELTIGSSFSSALEKQGTMFPALLINMIKAAEASGTLIETLDDMANYYTEIDETKKQMKSAMTYPLIVSIFALFVLTFIMVYIIPKFVEVYESNEIELKGMTLFVVNMSNFLKGNFVVIIGVLILSIVGVSLAYKNVKAFRKNIQTILMHIPVVKNLIIYNELTIFTKTFASLLRNNVFITDTIDILSKITNNEIYKGILYRTINNIVKGEKISEAFKDHWAIPDVAYFMIVTGESTGELDDMMQKVSDYYQGLHRNTVNSLKAFIEPVMISVLALVVGVIIVSVVVPMFGMYEEVMV
jgi:type IV pilus assembly protein PilC